MTGVSKDKFKQIPGKIMFGNGISWTCLISLDLKRKKRKKSSKPGKQKRMKLKSAREAAAGSRVGEPVGLSPSQPSPG